MKVYLDACCLNRPFDDQQQDRIRLESEAVLRILSHIESQVWEWASSEVVDLEIAQSPDEERTRRIQELIRFANSSIRLEVQHQERVRELLQLGFHLFDALHIACAEAEAVDVFLSTDDRLVRAAERSAHLLQTRVANPLIWIAEVSVS